MEQFDLVHAGPTCGKSTLIANWESTWLLDPDTFIWGPLLSKRDNEILKKLEVAPWYTKGDKRASWRAVENGAKFVVFLLAKAIDATIVTNQFYHEWAETARSLYPNRKAFDFPRSLTVFRSAEEMFKLSKARASAKGKEGSTSSLDLYKHWYEGWSKHHGDYTDVVQLEDGEYLTDVFSVPAKIVDAKQVEKLNYLNAADAVKDFLSLAGKLNNSKLVDYGRKESY